MEVEFEEFEQWISESMEIQDFILRYTGVQTISRARRVYQQEREFWEALFNRISVEYFGKRYVEFPILKKALWKEMPHISDECKTTLSYLFTYDGQKIIEKNVFDKVFKVWSSFSANDINNDGELDVEEIRMMWWLLDGVCPDNAKL